MNFDDLEAITELVASFFLALYIWMSHPVQTYDLAINFHLIFHWNQVFKEDLHYSIDNSNEDPDDHG